MRNPKYLPGDIVIYNAGLGRIITQIQYILIDTGTSEYKYGLSSGSEAYANEMKKYRKPKKEKSCRVRR